MGWRETVAEDGYAVLPGIFPAGQMEVVSGDILQSSAQRSRAGIRHAMRLNAVASIANSPQLTEIACTILGKMAFPYRATVFEKSPGSNWLVVWHQDTALPVFSRIELAGWDLGLLRKASTTPMLQQACLRRS